MQADVYFTDVNPNTVTIIGAQTPNPVVHGTATYGNGTAQNSVVVHFAGNSQSCTVNLALPRDCLLERPRRLIQLQLRPLAPISSHCSLLAPLRLYREVHTRSPLRHSRNRATKVLVMPRQPPVRWLLAPLLRLRRHPRPHRRRRPRQPSPWPQPAALTAVR
jgi:hypothetical protein